MEKTKELYGDKAELFFKWQLEIDFGPYLE